MSEIGGTVAGVWLLCGAIGVLFIHPSKMSFDERIMFITMGPIGLVAGVKCWLYNRKFRKNKSS